MKKIVLVLGMMMAMGGASTLYAAESNNAQAIRNGVVEQVTNRMERLLALTDLQAVDVLELNHEYYFLMEGVAPVSMSDRDYRRAWNSYERKLRRILSAHQYTLYLSNRGALYAPQPVRTPRVTVVPRPNPTPAPRQMMPQGRGNTQRPMATAPRGNNQRRPNATPQRPNGKKGKI